MNKKETINIEIIKNEAKSNFNCKMKTIDDLPIEILTHILFLTTPYIDIFVKLRLINSKWNKAVKHRLSRVKHLIQTVDDRYNKPPIRAETMFSIDPGCSYFNNSEWDDKYTRYFISLMEMLPGLQAVKMENHYKIRDEQYSQDSGDDSYFPDDLSMQNKIFSYFNSRPTIKALGIDIDDLWELPLIKPMLKVKLKNITMLSIKCEDCYKTCKEFIEYFFPTDHDFEQLWLDDEPCANSILQKKTKIRKLFLEVALYDWNWPTDNELPLEFGDLEIFGVSSLEKDVLEYLSKVTSLSPKLTSIHVLLCNNVQTEPMKNFKQFNQVENLVIEYKNLSGGKSFSYAEKIIRMYPMVKNLSIKNLSVLSQEEILNIFQWMPNLSILHLVYHRDIWAKEVTWTVDVDNLVSAYNKLHGRLIKICAVEKSRYYTPYSNVVIFKRGFDFMKHFFYSDHHNQPHILLE